MKVNRLKLVEALHKVLPVVSSNTIVPKHSAFMFSEGKIKTTNGVVTIDIDFPLDELRIDRCVPAVQFFRLLESIPQDEVDIVVKDSNLEVRTKKLEGKLVTLPLDDLEEKKEKNEVCFDIADVEDVMKALFFCRMAVSKDLTTGPLCGVHIHEGEVFGSDRYRIFCWEIAQPVSGLVCTLPALFIDMLPKDPEEISKIEYLGNAQSDIKNVCVQLKDSTRIRTTLIGGEYPNLVKYIPDDSEEGVDIEFEAGLLSVLSRHEAFVSNVAMVDRELHISIHGDNCKLKIQNKEYGSLEEECKLKSPLACGEDEIEFAVNPSLITEVLNKKCGITYYPDKRLLCLSGSEFQCVVQTRY